MRIDCIHDKDPTESVVLLIMLNCETKLHFAGTLFFLVDLEFHPLTVLITTLWNIEVILHN